MACGWKFIDENQCKEEVISTEYINQEYCLNGTLSSYSIKTIKRNINCSLTERIEGLFTNNCEEVCTLEIISIQDVLLTYCENSLVETYNIKTTRKLSNCSIIEEITGLFTNICETNELSSGTINLLEVYQECQTFQGNSGVKIVIKLRFLSTDINSYLYSYILQNANDGLQIHQLAVNEYFLDVPPNEHTGMIFTISNQTDSYTFIIYSSTCDHNGMLTNCVDNNREVSITLLQQDYHIGQNITANYTSGYENCNMGVNWYNSGIPFHHGFSFTDAIQSFLCILHAQLGHSNENCKQCHGWTEIHIRESITLLVDNNIIIGFQLRFIVSNINKTKSELLAAKNKGAEFVQLVILTRDLFKNLADYNNNLSYLYSQYDEVINYAATLYNKIDLRICLDTDDTEYYYQGTGGYVGSFSNALFHWFTTNEGTQEMALDEFGNLARINAGSGHGSLSLLNTRNKMKTIFRNLLSRYNGILGNKLNSVCFLLSAQEEMGENYENEYYNSNGNLSLKYNAIYDYHLASIILFRAFVINKHGSLANAGTYHGLTYTTINDINLPKTNLNIDTQFSSVNGAIDSLQTGNLWYDWCLHNEEMHYNFYDEIKVEKDLINLNIKLIGEFGSATDVRSRRRFTHNILRQNSAFDILKTEFSNKNWDNTLNISSDLIRGNFGKKINTEINENDPPTQGGLISLIDVKNVMFDVFKQAYNNGVNIVSYIGDSNSSYWNNTLDLISESKQYVINNSRTISLGTNMNITLYDLYSNYENTVNQWLSLTANGTQRKNIIIT